MMEFWRNGGKVLANMPTDETIRQFLEALPRMEKLANALPEPEKLDRLLALFEHLDIATQLRRLEQIEPLLMNLPKDSTLVDLVNMRGIIAQIPTSADLRMIADRLPTRDEMKAMTEQLATMAAFAKALKGD